MSLQIRSYLFVFIEQGGINNQQGASTRFIKAALKVSAIGMITDPLPGFPWKQG